MQRSQFRMRYIRYLSNTLNSHTLTPEDTAVFPNRPITARSHVLSGGQSDQYRTGPRTERSFFSSSRNDLTPAPPRRGGGENERFLLSALPVEEIRQVSNRIWKAIVVGMGSISTERLKQNKRLITRHWGPLEKRHGENTRKQRAHICKLTERCTTTGFQWTSTY